MFTASQILLGFGLLLMGIIIGVFCTTVAFIGVYIKTALENKERAIGEYDDGVYKEWD
jgi:hypothetical protein